MFYVYTFDSKGNKIVDVTDYSRVAKKIYDDIVDRSQFRPDSEQTRIFQLTGSGAQGKPSYDSEEPSDIAVMIRSGKFDKAEVANIMRNRADEFAKENDSKKADKKAKELQELNDARQAFLDQKTGFTGVPQSKVGE